MIDLKAKHLRQGPCQRPNLLHKDPYSTLEMARASTFAARLAWSYQEAARSGLFIINRKLSSAADRPVTRDIM